MTAQQCPDSPGLPLTTSAPQALESLDPGHKRWASSVGLLDQPPYSIAESILCSRWPGRPTVKCGITGQLPAPFRGPQPQCHQRGTYVGPREPLLQAPCSPCVGKGLAQGRPSPKSRGAGGCRAVGGRGGAHSLQLLDVALGVQEPFAEELQARIPQRVVTEVQLTQGGQRAQHVRQGPTAGLRQAAVLEAVRAAHGVMGCHAPRHRHATVQGGPGWKVRGHCADPG